MANTHTILYKNVIGKNREEYGTLLLGGATEGAVVTHLRNIDFVSVQEPGNTSRRAPVYIYINSASDSATEDDPGTFYLKAGTDTATYYYRAVGS